MQSAGERSIEDEFDTMARWTHEAVLRLGPEHALPAACRGSGKPAALDWLLHGMGADTGSWTDLLDLGAGLGGPAAYASRARGAAGDLRPLCVDPMRAACDAAVGLFGLPVLVAEGRGLPFASGVFEAAWSLGTLCTTTEKSAWLAELRRVLRPGAPLGLLVVVARDASFETSWGNAFPCDSELTELLVDAGFAVTARAWSSELPDADARWQAAEDAVEREVQARHGDDERFARIREQEAALGALLEEGRVRGRLLVARAI